MASYTHQDMAGFPASTNVDIDSGVASAPADRPSTFTPPTGYVASTSSSDYSVSTTAAVRPMVFERQSLTATIDPGLATSG